MRRIMPSVGQINQELSICQTVHIAFFICEHWEANAHQTGKCKLDVKQLVGSRIKALRTKKGLTQDELSERVGINPKYLSSIERGKENPTFNTLIALSESLGVEFGELFGLLQAEDPKASKKIVKSMIDNADDEQIKLILKVVLAVVG